MLFRSNVRIDFPIVQAALSGYSDMPMRTLARRHGAGYGVCEVMLDQFLLAVKKRQKTRHFLAIHKDEHPVGGQLMGAEPDQFVAGAMRLVAAGYDVIDINFGCPVKKVLGRCRGGFHLSQPEVALEIIRRTRDAIPESIPVTLKMRRGIDETALSQDRFFTILDGAFSAGLAAVTVHGRTVQQRYVGPSRWDFLRQVKQHVGPDRVLLGSGDLFSAEDCLRMIAETGVDGVTIARGSIGNPWIYQQVKALASGQPKPPPPTLHQQAAVMREHYALCEQTYGADRTPLLMRKFCIKYAASHPRFVEVRKTFTKMRTQADFQEALLSAYGEEGPGQYVPREVHSRH